MAALGNKVENMQTLGTGGVDDLIMIQDFGVTTAANGGPVLQGGPNFAVPKVPVPPIAPIPAPAVLPKSAFELHSAIWLKAKNDAATAARISGYLAEGPAGLWAAVQEVFDNGVFNDDAAKTKFTNTMTEVLGLVPVVGPDPSGNAPAEPSGVPRLRLVQEFHDRTGKPRWFFELRMRVELTDGDYATVRGFLAGNSLPDAKHRLITSNDVQSRLDPRVRGNPAYDAVIRIL